MRRLAPAAFIAVGGPAFLARHFPDAFKFRHRTASGAFVTREQNQGGGEQSEPLQLLGQRGRFDVYTTLRLCKI
jgi:hypothetical protein